MVLDQIEYEAEVLSPEDFVQLLERIAEKGWGLWDVQLKKDATAGKLDFFACRSCGF